jgi:uncharacterized protein YeeX (DUF496 family)
MCKVFLISILNIFKFSRAERDCHDIERQIQEAKGKINETQKRVNQHDQTVKGLDKTINEVKIKCGRLGKVKIRKSLIKYLNLFC